MFYFCYAHGEVTTRDFEYNSEALSGSISLVNEGAECALLMHTPTAKFNYMVNIKRTGDANQLMQGINGLQTEPTSPPSIYYKVVLMSLLNEYLADPNFQFIKEKTVPEIKFKPQILPPKRSVLEPELEEVITDKQTNPLTPQPQIAAPDYKLARNMETPVYSYKSPSNI